MFYRQGAVLHHQRRDNEMWLSRWARGWRLWVGDYLINTNSVPRLNYYVCREMWRWRNWSGPCTCWDWDTSLQDNCLYLGYKELMVSFLLLESVSEYKTAIMKRDIDRSADSAEGSENNRRSLSRDTRIQAAGSHNQHRWGALTASILIETNIATIEDNRIFFIRSRAQVEPPSCYPVPAGRPGHCFKFQMRSQLWLSLLEWDYCNICSIQNSALSLQHCICWGWIWLLITNHL